MLNVGHKSFRENQNTHFVFNNFLSFLFSKIVRIYELMWGEKIIQPVRPQMAILRMRKKNAFFMPDKKGKNTDKNS
jgi:hypothetical protein